MLRIFALALTIVVTAAGALTLPAAAQSSGSEFAGQELPFIVTGEDYFLKKGDVVEVTVREDPSLNRRLMIGPDGKINMTIAGLIIAAGSTVEALQNDILRGLRSSFVTDPTVTVSLVALAEARADAAGAPEVSKRIFVLGEVARPGPYDVDGGISVLQALSLAGGFGDFAATKRIQVRSQREGQEVVQIFNYDDIEDGEITKSNIELLDGDVIVVPKRGLFE